MSLGQRHAKKIAGQRKAQNLTPTVWKDFVESDDTL